MAIQPDGPIELEKRVIEFGGYPSNGSKSYKTYRISIFSKE